jgi:hypothetical protein
MVLKHGFFLKEGEIEMVFYSYVVFGFLTFH